MKRAIFGATAVALLAFVPWAVNARQTDPDNGRYPVLIHDVSGGTLVGPVQATVMVWSNGDVTFSRKEFFGPATVGHTKLSPQQLDGFVTALHEAGAGMLEDQWPEVMDVPLNTVTMLGPGADSMAHTFCYWIGTGRYEAVDAVLDRMTMGLFPVR